jgi:uncharacterized protein (TIGR00251 family)
MTYDLNQDFILVVKIITNASKNEIIGWENKYLKIKISKAPDKDKANRELIKFLSNKLKISQSRIIILKGMHSRIKKLKFQNLTKAQFSEKIN